MVLVFFVMVPSVRFADFFFADFFAADFFTDFFFTDFFTVAAVSAGVVVFFFPVARAAFFFLRGFGSTSAADCLLGLDSADFTVRRFAVFFARFGCRFFL